MSCHVGDDNLSGSLAGTYEFGVDSSPETGTVFERTGVIERLLFQEVRMERTW